MVGLGIPLLLLLLLYYFIVYDPHEVIYVEQITVWKAALSEYTLNCSLHLDCAHIVFSAYSVLEGSIGYQGLEP